MNWLDDALAAGSLQPSKVSTICLPRPLLWRVYPQRYGPGGFNGTRHGDARFSPLEVAGALVPTLYAGSTLEVTLMETVLRDIPSPSDGFILTLKESTEARRVAALQPSASLHLIDLGTIGLRRLGLARCNVIDSSPADYLITRRLAAWLYANQPDAHGICWTSRQNDEGRAVVLFEPRLGSVELVVQREEEAFTSGPHLDTLLGLTERLGASVIVR